MLYTPRKNVDTLKKSVDTHKKSEDSQEKSVDTPNSTTPHHQPLAALKAAEF